MKAGDDRRARDRDPIDCALENSRLDSRGKCLSVDVVIDGNLADVGHVPELIRENRTTAVGASEEDLAPSRFQCEGRGQRLGPEGFRDEIGEEVEFGQGRCRARSDGGDPKVPEYSEIAPESLQSIHEESDTVG